MDLDVLFSIQRGGGGRGHDREIRFAVGYDARDFGSGYGLEFKRNVRFAYSLGDRLRERQPGRAVGEIDHYFFASAGDERERAAYEQQNGQKKSQ